METLNAKSLLLVYRVLDYTMLTMKEDGSRETGFQSVLVHHTPTVYSTAGKSLPQRYLHIVVQISKAKNQYLMMLAKSPVHIYDFACIIRYKYDMSVEEASELARRSIYHATFRDGASGGVASG